MSRWVYAGTCSQGYNSGFVFHVQLEPSFPDPAELRVALISRCKPCGCTVFTRPAMTVTLPALVAAIESGDFDAVTDYDDADLYVESLADHVEDVASLLALARAIHGTEWPANGAQA